MRVGLNEDNELTIVRFIKGLSHIITNKLELQPYLSFSDIFHLAIKIEKQLKDRRPFPIPSPHRPQKKPLRVSPPITKLTLPLLLSRTLIRVKGLLVSLPRGRGKKMLQVPWLWTLPSEFS